MFVISLGVGAFLFDVLSCHRFVSNLYEMGFYKNTYFVYNMSMKEKKLYMERIRKVLSDQNGMIIASDLARLGIPRTYLSIMEKKREIERVSRGVYKMPSTLEDEMFIFQSKYKSSVYSHETALFLHDLTDRTPLHYSITIPSGHHAALLNKSGHKIYYVTRKLLNLGVTVMQSPQGNEVRVTNLERTICDTLRSRNQMDVQYVTNALKRYVTRKEKNINLLYSYASTFHVQKIVRQYIEVLL